MSDPILKKFPIIGWIKAESRERAAEIVVHLNMGYPNELYDTPYHFNLPPSHIEAPAATSDEQYALMWANGMSFKDIVKIMRAEANRGQS